MAGWKNFLKDLGSAVVPAAMTIGATALTGGAALAPMTLLAAGGAGAKGFARNEEEERRRKQMKRQAEENRRAQGAANLINSLQPGTGARARPSEIAAPKAGFGEILAGGAATGIQAYTMAKQTQDAWKQRELERQASEASLEQIRGSDEAERMALEAQNNRSQIAVEEALSLHDSLTPTQRADGGFATGRDEGMYVMPETTAVAERPEAPPPLGFLTGMGKTQRANRQMDSLERRESPYDKLRREELLRMRERIRVTGLVIQDPRAFQNLSPENQLEALLGLHGSDNQASRDLATSLTGRDLSASQQAGLDASNNVLQDMMDVTALYRDAARIEVTPEGKVTEESSLLPGGGGLGPLATLMNLPAGEDKRKINLLSTQLDKLAGSMRSAVESGVMSQDDYNRWRKLMPDIYSLNQVGEYQNFEFLSDQMKRALENERKSLLSTGYKIPTVGQGKFSTDIDDVVRLAEQGDQGALQFLRYGQNLGLFGVE